jgi:preprotein translocase subunit Sss1
LSLVESRADSLEKENLSCSCALVEQSPMNNGRIQALQIFPHQEVCLTLWRGCGGRTRPLLGEFEGEAPSRLDGSETQEIFAGQNFVDRQQGWLGFCRLAARLVGILSIGSKVGWDFVGWQQGWLGGSAAIRGSSPRTPVIRGPNSPGPPERGWLAIGTAVGRFVELMLNHADRPKREEFSARFAVTTECDRAFGFWREGLILSHCANYIIHHADRPKREEFSARFAAITECDQGFGLKREGLIFSHCANYIILHADRPKREEFCARFSNCYKITGNYRTHPYVKFIIVKL